MSFSAIFHHIKAIHDHFQEKKVVPERLLPKGISHDDSFRPDPKSLRRERITRLKKKLAESKSTLDETQQAIKAEKEGLAKEKQELAEEYLTPAMHNHLCNLSERTDETAKKEWDRIWKTTYFADEEKAIFNKEKEKVSLSLHVASISRQISEAEVDCASPIIRGLNLSRTPVTISNKPRLAPLVPPTPPLSLEEQIALHVQELSSNVDITSLLFSFLPNVLRQQPFLQALERYEKVDNHLVFHLQNPCQLIGNVDTVPVKIDLCDKLEITFSEKTVFFHNLYGKVDLTSVVDKIPWIKPLLYLVSLENVGAYLLSITSLDENTFAIKVKIASTFTKTLQVDRMGFLRHLSQIFQNRS